MLPKRNTELTLYLDVWSNRDNVPDPVYEAGDVRVSKDGGAFVNIATLPVIEPAGTDISKLTLSAAEMDADIVIVAVLDRSADPIDELLLMIYTGVSTVDDVATVAGAIQAKTDALPADPSSATNVTNAQTAIESDIAGLNDITATDVWSAATRTLTAGTKDAEIDAVKAKTDNLPASPASAGDVASARDAVQADIAALNDITVADILGGAVEGSHTLQQAMRIMLSVLAGKSSGGGTTTITFRDTGDSTNRVVATVDGNGNRSEVTINAN